MSQLHDRIRIRLHGRPASLFVRGVARLLIVILAGLPPLMPAALAASGTAETMRIAVCTKDGVIEIALEAGERPGPAVPSPAGKACSDFCPACSAGAGAGVAPPVLRLGAPAGAPTSDGFVVAAAPGPQSRHFVGTPYRGPPAGLVSS